MKNKMWFIVVLMLIISGCGNSTDSKATKSNSEVGTEDGAYQVIEERTDAGDETSAADAKVKASGEVTKERVKDALMANEYSIISYNESDDSSVDSRIYFGDELNYDVVAADKDFIYLEDGDLAIQIIKEPIDICESYCNLNTANERLKMLLGVYEDSSNEVLDNFLSKIYRVEYINTGSKVSDYDGNGIDVHIYHTYTDYTILGMSEFNSCNVQNGTACYIEAGDYGYIMDVSMYNDSDDYDCDLLVRTLLDIRNSGKEYSTEEELLALIKEHADSLADKEEIIGAMRGREKHLSGVDTLDITEELLNTIKIKVK